MTDHGDIAGFLLTARREREADWRLGAAIVERFGDSLPLTIEARYR